ncbi:MAG: YkgJ family cysteine cluster protein [Spirochaetaceae bacterium]|nr:YkgJ family cysteine cluster protein [Spirochaetaceae bacterium]
MAEQPFYSSGLYFSCTRCSACCRYDPGYVFLSKKDVEILAAELKMDYSEFIEVYCRWVPQGGGPDRLSLKEKSNYDCVFWKDGCSVYKGRPLQCRNFPFWYSILASFETWKIAAESCPGIGKGNHHNMDYIESCLAQGRAESIITRKNPIARGR